MFKISKYSEILKSINIYFKINHVLKIQNKKTKEKPKKVEKELGQNKENEETRGKPHL